MTGRVPVLYCTQPVYTGIYRYTSIQYSYIPLSVYQCIISLSDGGMAVWLDVLGSMAACGQQQRADTPSCPLSDLCLEGVNISPFSAINVTGHTHENVFLDCDLRQ